MKKKIFAWLILVGVFFITTSESCKKATNSKDNAEENELVTEETDPTNMNESSLWMDVDTSTISDPILGRSIPKESRLVNLNIPLLKSVLKEAPQETAGIGIESCPVIQLPLPDGSTQSFHVFESPSMDPELAKKYGLSSYTGQGIEDKTATLKCELTPDGFRAQILSTNGTIVIDPVKDAPQSWYMAYRK